ncbi:MAG: crotonase/enoyl-CoA hydratase family protein [Candidatus Binatia bacterium]
MSDRVTVEIDGGVADVRLTRAEKLNALDPAMFTALADAARTLAGDRSLRAVVLSGEGRAFCAGLDFSSFSDLSAEDGPQRLLVREDGGPANFAQNPSFLWTELPIPVIAAVHGACLGGGLQIALGADIRFVAPDAQLSVMEIKWGLVPDMAGTQALRHLVGLDVAKELTFTGRVVSGTRAVELGLATHVSDTPREDALALAREISSKSPDAIRAGKRLLNASRRLDLEAGLKLESELQASLLGRPNQREAVYANLEQRVAEFQDPE